jgi:uncharacterized protein (TIGR00156 family)
MNRVASIILVLILVLGLGLFLSDVYAQYTGPGAGINLTTVNEVIANASQLDKSDKQVKLKGFVIEQINKDTFRFKDATGIIMVEIEKKQMPTVPFNEKQEVIIIGEVDYDLLEGCEIEVDCLIIQ